MEDTSTERTPLLQDGDHTQCAPSSREGTPNTSTDSTLIDSQENKKNQLASRRFSTIDCRAHPEDCLLVTGIGLLALDGGWGWVVVFATMLCNFLQASMSRTFGVLYPTIRLRYQSTVSLITAIQSISNSLRLFGAPISSSLCEWVGARRLVIIGGTLQALGYGISALAPNIYFLYFSLGVLTGIGGALTYTPTHILVNKYFNKKRGLALGLATSGVGIGTFLMAPIQTFLLLHYGFIGYCMMMGGILLNYLVGGALLRPIESNHAAHKVVLAEIERQKNLAQRRLHASTCSNPSVFYESVIEFDPATSWGSNIPGVDVKPDDMFDYMAGSIPSNMVGSLPSIIASSVPSNMAEAIVSNIAADNVSVNVMPSESEVLMATNELSNMANSRSNMAASARSRVPGEPTSYMKVDTVSSMTTGTMSISNSSEREESTSDDADSNMAANYVPHENRLRDTTVPKETDPLLSLTKDKQKSVVIHSAVTAISASTTSTPTEQQNRDFLASWSSSIRYGRESFAASMQHMSKEIAFFRKKFKLFTILAFVMYSGQNIVLQFCTAVPLIFLPQLGMENGYTETASAFLISISGIFDIVGRYVFGILFDIQCIVPQRRLLHGILGLLLGTATFCLGLTGSYVTMLVGAAFHGMMAGGYHAQKTSIVSEFVPITLMSDAVGFSFFFEGFGSLVAAPLFGLIVDQYSTYCYSYFGCGAIFIFFTVLVLVEYCISGIRRNR